MKCKEKSENWKYMYKCINQSIYINTYITHGYIYKNRWDICIHFSIYMKTNTSIVKENNE